MVNYESINERLGFDFIKFLDNSRWDDDIEANPIRLLTQEEKDFMEKDLTEKVKKQMEQFERD